MLTACGSVFPRGRRPPQRPFLSLFAVAYTSDFSSVLRVVADLFSFGWPHDLQSRHAAGPPSLLHVTVHADDAAVPSFFCPSVDRAFKVDVEVQWRGEGWVMEGGSLPISGRRSGRRSYFYLTRQ